jgi:sterol 14-demethylase
LMAGEDHALMAKMGNEGVFDPNSRLGSLVMRVAAHAFVGRDLGGFLGYDFFGDFRHFSEGTEPVLPLWLPLPRLVRSRRAKRRLHDQMGRLIQSRRQKGVDPPDFLQRLVETTYSDGTPLPDRVIVNVVLSLMWTGQETVTGQLSWTLIDLLRHPEYLKEVLEELHTVMGDDLDVSLPRLGRLQRLHWAIQESERLHPVAHVIMRMALEPIERNGYSIPEGAMVIAPPCIAHRVPDLFPEPDRYLPARFAGEQSDPHQDFRLIGFGGGPHRCPGMDFAFAEMKVVLALLLSQFELTLLDPDPQPAPGPRMKWPASCRVAYRRK